MYTRPASPYNVTAEPAISPISVTEARAQLKLGSDVDAALDAELTRYINAAVAAGERYTRRYFITRTFVTYRDRFSGDIVLRRNPVQSVSHIKYYKDGVLATVDASMYYLTVEPDWYPCIILYEDQSWPTDVDSRKQAIQVTFKCGYGDAAASVPAPLREGMLQHVAQLWTHRGDTDGMASAPADAMIPAIARALYDKYRIIEVE